MAKRLGDGRRRPASMRGRACRVCDGQGYCVTNLPPLQDSTCPACKGTGRQPTLVERFMMGGGWAWN